MNRLAQVLPFVLAVAFVGCGGDSESPPVGANPAAKGMPLPNAKPETMSTAPVAEQTNAAGAAVYVHYCADCHDSGPGHPGTMRLEVRLGVDLSVLRERTDVVPDYVKMVVRNGFQMMPAFRPTEITDAELEDLASYVALRRESATNETQ
jgi:mono/diheme cytochrome c family protein